MRNTAFANESWQPAGPTLKLRNASVAGPFPFMNPTTAMFEVQSNDAPGGQARDISDLTDPENQERAKVQWNARDYRKGRHILHLPKHSPLARQLAQEKHNKVLLGILRMFTVFPYWDISWLIGISFTIGCLIFVVCGFFYYMPLAYPSTEFKGESAVAGGITAFIGATLFQAGAILLVLEAYNDRAETQFGGAFESLFADRLKLKRRKINRTPRHYEVTAGIDPTKQEDGTMAPNLREANMNELHKKETEDLKRQESSTDDGKTDGYASDVAPDQVVPAQLSYDMKDTFTERKWQWLPSWYDVKTHYIYEIGFLASCTMSLGATIFYVTGVMALPGIYDKLTEVGIKYGYYFCYLFGGILFILSSLLYMMENQSAWWKPAPKRIGWHIGLFNLIGGIGWSLAASLGYCTPDWCELQSELSLIWASASFAWGSGLQWYESLDKYVIVIDD